MKISISVNKKIYTYLEQMSKAGEPLLALQGARRAGKTYTICQWLLLRMLQYGDVVVVASMTAEQGRRGAYEDCRQILSSWDVVAQYFDIKKSPREIQCLTTPNGKTGGVMYFASFADPETAKGVACDWVFINEANKFTKQQYLDLAANARKGVILDYNPQRRFWVDDFLCETKILQVTWQDNKKHLTAAQLQWFDQLKQAAEKEGATQADRYYYEVYYNGRYADISGNIYNGANTNIIKAADVDCTQLCNYAIFCDPSALRGNDYTAAVLAGSNARGEVFILDCFSANRGEYTDVVRELQRLGAQYDGVRIFIETNGLVGVQFFEYCQNSGLPVEAWCSRGNKDERIIASYQDWTQHLYFVEGARLGAFLAQCYEYGERGVHDDNIDAVCTMIMIQKNLRSYC